MTNVSVHVDVHVDIDGTRLEFHVAFISITGSVKVHAVLRFDASTVTVLGLNVPFWFLQSITIRRHCHVTAIQCL